MIKPDKIVPVFLFLLSVSCNLLKSTNDLPPLITAVPTAREKVEVIGNDSYIVQDGTPAHIPNFVRPSYGCDWSGIAGQVFDTNGVPQVNLVTEIQGTLNGEPALFLTLTGDSTEVGPGGYLITFTDNLVASEGTLTIQLFDLNGNSLSKRINFNTLANCEQNLVIVNFVQIPSTHLRYLPFIRTE